MSAKSTRGSRGSHGSDGLFYLILMVKKINRTYLFCDKVQDVFSRAYHSHPTLTRFHCQAKHFSWNLKVRCQECVAIKVFDMIHHLCCSKNSTLAVSRTRASVWFRSNSSRAGIVKEKRQKFIYTYVYLFPEDMVNNAGSVFEDVELWKELLQSCSRV